MKNKMEKGCKFETNLGTCGKNNYLCAECRNKIRQKDKAFNKKFVLGYEKGFNQGKSEAKKEMENSKTYLELIEQGKKTGIRKAIEVIKKYKYNTNGSYDIKEKGNYTRISFNLFIKELIKKLDQQTKGEKER